MEHHQTTQNSLEVLRRSIRIPSEEPIDVNHSRGKQTEECSESNHDDVSNRQTKRRNATEVRVLTAILVEGGRARFDGAGEGRLAHDVVCLCWGLQREVKLG